MTGKSEAKAAVAQNAVQVTTSTKVIVTQGRQTAPIWNVLRKARAKFDAQLKQDTETKRECIAVCINFYYGMR